MFEYKKPTGMLLALCLIFLQSTRAHADGQAGEPIKKVALEIYFYDNISIDKNSEDLFERMFTKLRPDLIYKRISIKAQRLGGNKQNIAAEIREKIAGALAPDERLAYLLIDTHGNTSESHSGRKVTKLQYLGNIYENGVDPDFNEVFSPIKDKATNDLRIILNSCSTFCGGQESAARRGEVLLNYFGAVNGGIYGSDTFEVAQSLDHADYIKWKYIRPSLKTFLTFTVAVTVLMLPQMGHASLKLLHDQIQRAPSFLNALSIIWGNTLAASAMVGTGYGTILSVLKPVFQIAMSRSVMNRGYFFALQNGQLAVGVKIIKYKEIKNLIAHGAVSPSCKNILENKFQQKSSILESE